MDQEEAPLSPIGFIKCGKCGCSCALTTSSPGETWIRSVKRKYDEFDEKTQFHVPGLDISHVARVQVENECNALREMVSNQQKVIQELSLELDEERNASSSAANEAMSMILRLQREKAEVQMEARQFKRFSEEKIAHDAEEISAVEDLLYSREQTIQSLTCEVQAYKHRMMSFGLTESEAEGFHSDGSPNRTFGEIGVQVESPGCNYPPLRCKLNNVHTTENDDVIDIEKYPFAETPHDHDHLKSIEYRINQLERTPRGYELGGGFAASKNALAKVNVHSPKCFRNPRGWSTDSPFSRDREVGPDYPVASPRSRTNSGFKKMACVDEDLKRSSDASDVGDDMSDRVYTIDSVHHVVPYNNAKESKPPLMSDKYVTTPRESLHRADFGDTDVKKLYLRLQALEADRESLRQTIISMQTDKAQLVLLREIAQQLCKDMSTERRMPVKKQSFIGNFSFMGIFKWFLSIIFWRKGARRSKYMFGPSANSVGLLAILDKGPRMKHWSWHVLPKLPAKTAHCGCVSTAGYLLKSSLR